MAQKEVLVFITTHFDEIPTVYCLCQMRAEGIAARLVGLTPGIQTGLRGLKVRPDTYLTELEAQPTNGCRLLVIAGAEACRARLLSDPRVHRSATLTLEANGLVAIMAPQPGELAFLGERFPERREQLLFQRGAEFTEFVEELIDRFST